MNLIKMTRREKYPFEKINLHLEGYSKIESKVVSSIRLTTVRERVTSFVKLSVNKSNKVNGLIISFKVQICMSVLSLLLTLK